MSVEGTCKRELHLVTGGCGYAGYNLAKRLLRAGHDVRMFDIQQPIWPALDRAQIITGDIRKLSDVESAFETVDCVYHLASYGMSGREQLNKTLIEEVNVLGTKNVIKACCKKGVKRLVYTSTYNVVFGGQVIVNGDESLPYLPLDKHPDHYSRTKSIAEREVIKANGCALSGGGTLQTCALRLAGVYGPGEQRHLPRIVGYLELGLFSFTYGEASNRVDFLHVDNLVEAHYLAGLALTDSRKRVAAGQVYFISDNKPVNNFEFLRPLVEGLGYDFPKINLPIMLIYFFAYMTEWLHYLVGRLYNFQPLLTRTEVYKTGVTHYFSMEKAQRELGYAPQRQNDMAKVVEHFRKLGRVNSKRKQSSGLWTVVLNLILVCLVAAVIMSFIPIVT